MTRLNDEEAQATSQGEDTQRPARSGSAARGAIPGFWEVLEGRRTVRFYAEEPVPDEALETLLRAATLAPSAHNAQPWRVVVLQNVDVRRQLTEAMATRWEQDMRRSAIGERVIKAELEFSLRRFTSAPVLLLVCLTMEEMDRYPDPGRRRAEQTMGIQSVAAAIQNLLLAAEALGIGACWCCAPLFCQGLVRRILGLPRSWEPQALITLGFPRHHPPRPPRKSMEDVVRVL
ncbi:MAG: nitroreductase family protein [bacterium]|nr:nitroreductase family protein [bacterium]